jgi:hypothetical protein
MKQKANTSKAASDTSSASQDIPIARDDQA